MEATMKRFSDWEERLANWVEAAQRRPFKWGTFDCGLMAADAVEAQTGEDPAKDWRGKYKTRKGSVRELKRNGCSGFSDLGDQLLGAENSIHTDMLSRGDIAVGLFVKLETFIVDLGATFLVMTEHGARQADKSEVKTIRAWRIG